VLSTLWLLVGVEVEVHLIALVVVEVQAGLEQVQVFLLPLEPLIQLL
jgi:hypothetical protein